MALLRYDDFYTLATTCVRALTPKQLANAKKAIEFDLVIAGESFTFRAWAPSNYRQVWAKLPERYMEKYRKSEFHQKDVSGEWVCIADHDSGWTSGFNVFDYTSPPNFDVDLLSVRMGHLPVTTEGSFSWVDEQKGHHLAPLTDQIWSLEGLDCWDAYAILLAAFKEQADTVQASFSRRDKPSWRRMIEISDPAAARLVPRTGDRVKEKERPLTGEGLRSLLGRQDWRLWSVYLHKTGVHFF